MVKNVFECGIFNTNTMTNDKNKRRKRITKYFEIELLISCSGISYIDKKQYPLSPNTILLIKPGQERTSRYCEFKCFYIHCELDESNKYYQELMSCPTYFHVINSEKYIEIFESLIYYKNIKNCPNDSDIIKAKLMELFYFFIEDSIVNKTYLNVSKMHYNSNIQNAITYIKKHYDENLSLESLSKIANYSKNHFQHLFKTIMNCTPQQYILLIRIKQAKLLLNNPDIDLVDIAYQCGFSSQSYFNYIFKKETQLTPLEYRKMQANNYSI